MDDGTEIVAGPGGITSLPSGHDAWVVGDEDAVLVEFDFKGDTAVRFGLAGSHVHPQTPVD